MRGRTVQATVPAASSHSPQGTHGLRRPEQREASPVLASRAPGGRDVTSALRKPSAGRRDPPPPPTDTRVATKRPHHDPAATATEEAIDRARRRPPSSGIRAGRRRRPARTPGTWELGSSLRVVFLPSYV
uniref:Uncharacterized protein n=1 Tax=Setaria viridis TaxID=4556 RepID=A0A4U6UAG9_SETVI|nr:hypothetical protein SEVIR_7G300740v2 [Setaria viridis]